MFHQVSDTNRQQANSSSNQAKVTKPSRDRQAHVSQSQAGKWSSRRENNVTKKIVHDQN
jgi:hypothetical protein